ncbi:MAG: DUF4124 domain-containing protein [Burkholderiales bacterium]
MNGQIAVCVVALASSPLLAAQAYRWVDERGVVDYGEAVQQTETPRPVLAQAPAAVPVRGMDFDTYIRLQTGMSEGEVILRAGKPDYKSVENVRGNIVKSFYYYPTPSDPYITVVTLTGGRVSSLERTKKAN